MTERLTSVYTCQILHAKTGSIGIYEWFAVAWGEKGVCVQISWLTTLAHVLVLLLALLRIRAAERGVWADRSTLVLSKTVRACALSAALHMHTYTKSKKNFQDWQQSCCVYVYLRTYVKNATILLSRFSSRPLTFLFSHSLLLHFCGIKFLAFCIPHVVRCLSTTGVLLPTYVNQQRQKRGLFGITSPVKSINWRATDQANWVRSRWCHCRCTRHPS